MKLLFSADRAVVEAAEAKICENCGLPDGKGTIRWSNVFEVPGGFGIISAPENGRNQFSKKVLLNDIKGVTEIEYEFPDTGEI